MGKIFDPTQHTLPNNCKEFAQSPQTLVFDNFVRIYFSTRERDESTEKFLSRIAFVDMDKKMESVLNVSTDTVIKLGDLGTFDVLIFCSGKGLLYMDFHFINVYFKLLRHRVGYQY